MIRLQNVTKVYDHTVVAVKDVTIDVTKGEFVFLVGPSGSGKSTILRLVMREEKPDNGDVWVAGKHASALPSWKVPHLRRAIGTVFQDFKLLPNKTVYENVSFALEVTGRSRHIVRAQVPQVLKLVGLSNKADRYPRQLSGGEQQRVSVARAFVNRPLILLADEPTGNLDPATSVGIMRILDRINRTGTTVLMATHDHAIVDAMRRRVVQLEEGRVIRDQRSGVYEVRMQSGDARRGAANGEGAPAPSTADQAMTPDPAPDEVESGLSAAPESISEVTEPVAEAVTEVAVEVTVEAATEVVVEVTADDGEIGTGS